MDSVMRAKLLTVCEESERLGAAMGTQEIATNPEAYRKHAQKHAEMASVVACFRKYLAAEKGLQEARTMLAEESDADMLAFAQEEEQTNRAALQDLETELKLLLVPRDPNDDKDIIVEIRAGTGGDEAALFCADLFRMYTRYCETRGWRIEVMNSNLTELGGYKEITFQISGDQVYSQFKFEGGVHRVQRVPDTETQGRIHTSAVTVAVLPEAEEVEIQINENELQFDVYRSSGPGGQSVNTTDSAVRVTHKPTGLVVTCQDEKSQHKNKAKALRVLRSRLLALKEEEEAATRSSNRKSQVGSGDRSERIRTYNFPQNRLTDHRIKLTLNSLDRVMEGDIQGIFDALNGADRAAKLAATDE
ncbi:MAG: peptide chain release factor 1 [Candidatus Hydrogenedentes bacterium]|nr:peptide chain release factor 1 [Candidatus Hydrogenedentota bacterium]